MAWTLSRTCSATLQKINRGGCLPLITQIKKAITSQTVKTSAEPGRWLKTWEKSEKECLPSFKGRLSPVRQTLRTMIGSSVNWEKSQREKWGRLGKGHGRQNWWKQGLNSSFSKWPFCPYCFTDSPGQRPARIRRTARCSSPQRKGITLWGPRNPVDKQVWFSFPSSRPLNIHNHNRASSCAFCLFLFL